MLHCPPQEMAIFSRLCLEVAEASAVPLDLAAAWTISGRDQVALSNGLVGWSLAQAVAGDIHDAGEDLAWSIRLNRLDYAATESAVRSIVEPLIAGASEPMRRAAATALKLLGSRGAGLMAEELVGPDRFRKWRRVENYCETNPHDPSAPRGAQLANALAVAASIQGAEIWQLMGTTQDDMLLEDVTPALARFDPAPIVAALRRVICSIESRRELPLRQLSWRLPELSPLFDELTLPLVRTAYERLCSDLELARVQDGEWIISRIFCALTPHYGPGEQLELLLKMPPSVDEYLDLRHGLKPLDAKTLEQSLEAALGSSDLIALRRILFFASATVPELTERTRQIVAELTNNSDSAVAACASEVAFVAQDNQLNALVLEQPQSRRKIAPYEGDWRVRAVAAAIAEQKRLDLLEFVEPQFFGFGGRRNWRVSVSCVRRHT